jgi:hypothetical protein
MLRHLSLITLFLLTNACDDRPEGAPSSELVDLALDEAELDAVPDLAAQGRWVDGLEEFLDRECGDGGCEWRWSSALDDVFDDLPAIPVASETDGDHGLAHLTNAPDPAPAGTKSVKVNYIHCFETQDVGEDEPYLLMNGAKVWSKTGVKNGVSYNIGKSKPTQVLIELWDQDVSNNDKIGSFTVFSTKADGNYSALLNGAGGNYRVYYTVSTT